MSASASSTSASPSSHAIPARRIRTPRLGGRSTLRNHDASSPSSTRGSARVSSRAWIVSSSWRSRLSRLCPSLAAQALECPRSRVNSSSASSTASGRFFGRLDVRGVPVLPPRHAAKLRQTPGPLETLAIRQVADALAERLPPAKCPMLVGLVPSGYLRPVVPNQVTDLAEVTPSQPHPTPGFAATAPTLPVQSVLRNRRLILLRPRGRTR
jgi:hypothetical protein